MNSNSKYWTILPIIMGLSFLPGCSSAPQSLNGILASQSNRGKLEVSLLRSAGRTTQATTVDIDSITVTVQQTGVNPTSQTIAKQQFTDGTESSLTFQDLITGSATICVTVFNNNGAVIGQTKNTAVILANQTASMAFNIQLVPNINSATFGAGGFAATITIADGSTFYNYGVVSTLAGADQGYRDGAGTGSLFYNPTSLALDDSGCFYVADTLNNRIRKISATGIVSTFVGGAQGFNDSTGTAAKFYRPSGIAIASNGNLFVADSSNNRIRQVTPNGVVTTFAGNGSSGSIDGTGTNATFNRPTGICIDGDDKLYVADAGNNRIRVISPNRVVSTLAGTIAAGYLDSSGLSAQFSNPQGIAVDKNNNVYVADTGNNCIRKVTSDGNVSTLAGGSQPGFADATGTVAQFNQPVGVALDPEGSIYVADTLNNLIRKVSFLGAVTTIAGQTQKGYLDANGTNAQFYNPLGLAVGATGNIYVADTLNNRIRAIQ